MILTCFPTQLVSACESRPHLAPILNSSSDNEQSSDFILVSAIFEEHIFAPMYAHLTADTYIEDNRVLAPENRDISAVGIYHLLLLPLPRRLIKDTPTDPAEA